MEKSAFYRESEPIGCVCKERGREEEREREREVKVWRFILRT